MRNFRNQAHKNILDIWKCKIFFEFSNKRFQWLRIFVQIKDEHYFLEILRRHLASNHVRTCSADGFWDLFLLKKLRKYCIFSQQLYIVQKLYLSRAIQTVQGPFRRKLRDIRRALTFANTFKTKKMTEFKELNKF